VADYSRVLAMTWFPLVVMAALAIAARWPWRRLLRMPQTWLLILATARGAAGLRHAADGYQTRHLGRVDLLVLPVLEVA